jgi:hypothetical protein
MDLFISAAYGCLDATSTEPFLTLIMVQKVLLASPVRGGKKHMDANEKMINNRFTRWKGGFYSEVWHDVLAANSRNTRRNQNHQDENHEIHPSVLRKIKRLIEDGQLSRVCQRLSSRGVAEITPQSKVKISALFPQEPCIPKDSIALQDCLTYDITSSDVIQVIEQEPNGVSPGPCGLHAEILKDAQRHPDQRLVAEFVCVLVLLFNKMKAAELPEDCRSLFCAGRLVPCIKKDGGIRPIVMGCTITNLCSKVLLKQAENTICNVSFLPQVAIGQKGSGLQAAVLAAQSWAATLDGKIILKLDVANAFNAISRRACLNQTTSLLPALLPWAWWLLSGSSPVLTAGHDFHCSKNAVKMQYRDKPENNIVIT